MKNSEVKELKQIERTLSQQLHDARISAQLSLEQIHEKTKIPMHIIDKQEIGLVPVQLPILYLLAKAYNKKVQINLVSL